VRNSMNSMRAVRVISRSLCIVLLLLTCWALYAQNGDHRVRNIVLVHGAWADGSGWKGVYDILVKGGYNVSIVQEPETSFKEDVAATKRSLHNKMDRAFLLLTVTGEPLLPRPGRIHRWSVWYTSQPTCQTPVRMRLTTESASQVTSPSLVR